MNRNNDDESWEAPVSDRSTVLQDLEAEWLEADAMGGFASGTVGGFRTRRYHSLLTVATEPPAGRFVLINGIEVWAELQGGSYPLSAQRYLPDIVHPHGTAFLHTFRIDPWPTWTYRYPGGTEIVQQLMVYRAGGETVLAWRRTAGSGPAKLSVRPMLSGREYHSTHHENAAFDFTPYPIGGNVLWRPYPDVPPIAVLTNGTYWHSPEWYRNFFYRQEHDRDLDDTEDLASPGAFTFDLGDGEGTMILRAVANLAVDAPTHAQTLRDAERRRRGMYLEPLERSVDTYIVRRGQGRTILAGFPWFTDWGRDTFIAIRGLCLATGRLETAGEILTAWAGHVSEGMLPNRFPDAGQTPEYNSVDASLWYIVAVHEFLQAASPPDEVRDPLRAAVQAILEGYAKGTRYGIRMDADGLLACGQTGVQLTWMDAKVGDWVVTPRIGKPVEIQALWINALHIGGRAWAAQHDRALLSFRRRLWNAEAGCLFDVIDADHVSGRTDPAVRPNQILAVGGLPFPVIEGAPARQTVETVERELVTPMGLRTLSPDDPAYCGRYTGGVWQRDGAYHQGTTWPWLMGPFVDAWLRVHGDTSETREEARTRFLDPLTNHLGTAGLGHISEIADGDTPHFPRGCPFQAWSLGEYIRIRNRLVEKQERPES